MISTSDPLPSAYSCRSIPRLAFPRIWHSKSDSRLHWSKCTEYSRVLHGLQISTALSCNMFLHVPTTCSHSMFLPDPSSSSSPWTSALYGVCSHHRAPQQVYEVQNCNFSSLFKFFKFFKSFQILPGRIGNCNTGLLTTSSLQGLAVSKFLPKLQKSTPNPWRSKHGS